MGKNVADDRNHEVGSEVLCLDGFECHCDACQKPQPNITHHPSEKETECVNVCWGHIQPQKPNDIIHTRIQN